MQERLNTSYAIPGEYDPRASALEVSRVLRNTYTLLALTLAFSAMTAGASMVTGAPMIHPLLTLVVYFGLLFAVEKTKNSAWGLFWVFALTGAMGFTLGPILNFSLSMSGGADLVMLALGSTALVFFGMSGIALVSRKDFSGLSNFLFVGLLVAFIGGIANIFLQVPALALAVSSAFAFLSSMLILWQTSAIIHGGERNYISATVTLFVSIYNLFLSLLQLFMAFGGDD